MRKGEIWIMNVPLGTGIEEADQLPVVIVQDASYGEHSPSVLVVPLTHEQEVMRFPGAVELIASTENGLPDNAVAMVFQLRALSRSRLDRRLGEVTPLEMEELLVELDLLVSR
jgi:mRNA interferase MazF